MGSMRYWAARVCLVVITSVGLVAAVACGGASESPADAVPPTASQPAPQPSAGGGAPVRIALASSDLSVGPNRVVLGLIDPDAGPIVNARVQVSTFFIEGGSQEGPIETASAEFRKWPVFGGVYTVGLEFDRAGTWGLVVEGVEPEGATLQSTLSVTVRETSRTPAVGAAAPPSLTKTASDAANLGEITSDTDPDPELYATTIADALRARRPLLVAFSTPAYCQTATCGPQLDVVKELKAQYRDRVSFIHVEMFDNPDEIQGDLSRARTVPAAAEWGLPSEPWTFVVDAEGLVAAKFEGFATRDELEDALAKVLP